MVILLIRLIAFTFIFAISLTASAGDVPDRRQFLDQYPADARKIEQAYRSLTLKTRLEFPGQLNVFVEAIWLTSQCAD